MADKSVIVSHFVATITGGGIRNLRTFIHARIHRVRASIRTRGHGLGVDAVRAAGTDGADGVHACIPGVRTSRLAGLARTTPLAIVIIFLTRHIGVVHLPRRATTGYLSGEKSVQDGCPGEGLCGTGGTCGSSRAGIDGCRGGSCR